MAEIHMKKRFAAPPEKVFAAITDHVGMQKWMPGSKITLDREGVPAPNGLGAVRRIRAGGLTILEEVVHFDPPREMRYKVLKAGPIIAHLGTIRVLPAEDGGSLIDYTIRFTTPKWMGGELLAKLIGRILGGQLTAGLDRLATQVV
jgi:uncharacterized protein YndB with AHSA1/START domain